ncbi:MAG: rRNA cytosine-C5-methyltransferase [Prevotellaceae bacterium]|nr:rRNA cytosine-C5-methyltransferase [Prevotellaceae bacterium]
MSFPGNFKTRMQNLLGKDEWNDFAEALQQAPPVSIRYNRHKNAAPQDADKVAWCAMGRYLTTRPAFTLDPLLHAGAYYVQEASSMFLEQAAVLWRGQTGLRFLDLCAAPGGKSTHLADLTPAGSMLVSNEVIRSRTAALSENLTKWGNPNTVITHNDPKDFASLPDFFDVMLIDAPCSGEGLFRKEPAAVEAWSEAHVKHCAERQRRIVSDAWDALKEEGLLLYSTCTYNREENENNIRWMTQQLGAEVVHIPLQAAWNITTNEYGYRFFPHKTKGEGFFISLLRKKGRSLSSASPMSSPPKPFSRGERGGFLPSLSGEGPGVRTAPAWLNGDFTFVREGFYIYALPDYLVHDVFHLQQHLRFLQAGVKVGEVKGAGVVPAAALALSAALRNDAFPCADVDLATALRFLRREALALPHIEKGYCIIRYQHLPLGFVKNIGARSNNLHPPAWRIRMNI